MLLERVCVPVCVCIRDGFDREVEIWCMSLQRELVTPESSW